MTEPRFRSHRVFAWNDRQFVSFNSGANPTVAFNHIEDVLAGPPKQVRLARWVDGLLHVDDLSYPWTDKPRRLT